MRIRNDTRWIEYVFEVPKDLIEALGFLKRCKKCAMLASFTRLHPAIIDMWG